MIFHTANDVVVRFEQPSPEAIAWDRAQQWTAFQDIRQQLVTRGGDKRFAFRSAEARPSRQAA